MLDLADNYTSLRDAGLALTVPSNAATLSACFILPIALVLLKQILDAFRVGSLPRCKASAHALQVAASRWFPDFVRDPLKCVTKARAKQHHD